MSNENGQPTSVQTLYIGSYGSAEEHTIHVCSFNEKNGELAIIQAVSGLENASYLALHPNGGVLYAASETEATADASGGSVAAFEIEKETGTLAKTQNRVLTYGAHPCYISSDSAGKVLYAANYTGGNVALLPIAADGKLEAAASVRQHAGELGPNAARQDAPHAHCIVPLSGSPFVCAVDLGIDAIVLYRYDEVKRSLSPHGISKVHRGAGPRHLIFHPSLQTGYVMNELDSTITVLNVDAEQGILTAGKAISALPADYSGYNDAADIHLGASGRYLYSSNRGHNSIAVFSVDQTTGELSLIQHVDCGGESPRNFAITPDGGHLLAAHQKSGNIAVFAVDAENGTLTKTAASLQLQSPVCIKFAK
ncbi:6-phosphogluconolactonase [Paenibacillus endophyticus]|uniref:6-phosphogluconolactonase n=1 Tax=Paenibacillus endophyticus TaxID=1294268 RepID=A0A7W5G9H1_9BACL|nr:lactonase family protein [Paenibacillus endophyticus]MBB3150957.1 6-phosphogluconolactonase [Paenibacillus endophyticus]